MLEETTVPSATDSAASIQDAEKKTIPRISHDHAYLLNKIMEAEYGEEETSQLTSLYEATFGKVSANQLVKGKIVAIGENEVSIDIGFKSEGSVPIGEFSNIDELKVGDEIEVFLESVENKDGQLVLSRKRADFMRVWEKVTTVHETGEIIQGKILRRIKGGLVVDVWGIEAFLPGSQIDVKPIRDFDQFIDKTMDLKIVKVNNTAENIVVSHKVLVEEEMADQRNAILGSIEKGQILEGTVKAIADFGVFVDLGGVDGLIHITDLSWGRINHPTEVVKLDQLINVVVTEYDPDKKRISLGLKQLAAHPWENIEEKYPVGMKINGKIVSLTDYGAFVEIEKGIEGLIHISEMSWTQHIKHPSQVVSMGQMVDAIILSLDKENKKISLGIKQLEPDPWYNLLQKYPVGSKHRGVVRNLTNFGVFVELEQGVDGLIHISDLSWTKKIRHPGEVVKKNQSIDVVILGVDVEQRRISLGHKQIMDNPWDAFETAYKVGVEIDGTLTRIIEKGVIVELPLGVEGFVPASQLATIQVKNIADTFKVGDVLNLKVIEFDKDAKKIVLSVIEFLRGKEQKVVDEYVGEHKLPPMTIKDFVKAPQPSEIASFEELGNAPAPDEIQ
ncbi:MAG: 30S ribosomal protein S1 [Bacteroidota bacterium]|nr:30S ribosomal protein S1 [Bacteroidota bacterium]